MENKNEVSTFTETNTLSCPRDGSPATLTLVFKKATCTRVDDVLLHFICSRDGSCKECKENYL